MIITPRQKDAIRVLATALRGLGYRGDLFREDYSFRDWFSKRVATPTASIATFAQTPVSYSTACIGVAPANGLSGVDLVRGFRSLGAPVFLEVCEDDIVPWQVSLTPTAGDRLKPFRHDQVDGFFRENREILLPKSIHRTKNIPQVTQRQLGFQDLGLEPALEDHISAALNPILEKGFKTASAEYPEATSKDPDGAQLFQAAFWLLAGKVFRDRGHPQFAGLSEKNDPDEILRRVGAWYNKPISTRLLNKPARLALQQAIWGGMDFRNLSVEVLAEIWSTTLVTKELRKRLGIHSTPRCVVKYIVDHIPFEQIYQKKLRVVEPCCGSSRFLIAALQKLRLELPATMEAKTRHDYFKKTLAGYDLEPFGVEISTLGLTLADYPNPNGWAVHPGNVFASAEFSDDLASAGAVLCNPPFENLDKASQTRYSVSTPRQPAALLKHVLKHLHPDGVLGFVLPQQQMLDGQGYRLIREILVERFEHIELLSLPDRAFKHAQAETVVLLALSPRQHGLHRANVVHRKVDYRDWPAFRTKHEVTREDESVIGVPGAAKSLAIPDLAGIWDKLSNFQSLESVAELHRGIEWCKPISDRKEQGPKNLADIVRDSHSTGFHLGVPPGAKLEMYLTPPLKYLSMRPADERGNSYDHPWDQPKIIANKNRNSRGRWRLAAFVDARGDLVCYESFTAIWPNNANDIDWIAAVINSPLGSAFVSAHEHGQNTRVKTVKAIPLPSLTSADKGNVSLCIKGYQAAIAAWQWEEAWSCLRRLDAIIVGGYGLEPDQERALLRYFRGSERPLPEALAKREYSPESLGEGVTFNELLAITQNWEETNDKRYRLIKKEVKEGISSSEAEELARLQELADKRIQLFAPFRNEELRKVVESLHGR